MGLADFRLWLWSACKKKKEVPVVKTAKCWNQSRFNERLHFSSVLDQDKKKADSISKQCWHTFSASGGEECARLTLAACLISSLGAMVNYSLFDFLMFMHFQNILLLRCLKQWKHEKTLLLTKEHIDRDSQGAKRHSESNPGIKRAPSVCGEQAGNVRREGAAELCHCVDEPRTSELWLLQHDYAGAGGTLSGALNLLRRAQNLLTTGPLKWNNKWGNQTC